jgi:hypothetical protein
MPQVRASPTVCVVDHVANLRLMRILVAPALFCTCHTKVHTVKLGENHACTRCRVELAYTECELCARNIHSSGAYRSSGLEPGD